MFLGTVSWTLELYIVLVIFVSYFLLNRTNAFSYWQNLGIPSLPIDDILFGNVRQQILKRSSWLKFYQTCYEAFKTTGYGGIYVFSNPALVICDPNLVDKVLVEDFTYFQDRFASVSCQDLLSSALFQTTGEKWRIMRSKLLPAFTSGKVKGMFAQVFSCCNFIISQMTDAKSDIKAVDIETFSLSFAAEAIASCSFGIQIMSDPVERERFKRVVELVYNPPPLQVLKFALFWMNPKILTYLRTKLMNSEVTEYFLNMTRATIQFRDQSNINRDDFLQLMIQLKKQEESLSNDKGPESTSGSPKGPFSTSTQRIFTEDCIASQMFNFVNAGSTPSKVIISFVLFELSKNVEVQLRVQKDIDLAITKHEGWNFAALKNMTYLDQVIQETLRLHNYNPVLVRTVIQPYKIPGTQITLRKGTSVYIPTAAMHLDPQIYPSPEKFQPERFAGNNYKPSATYMPFGHGPRICISIKYAVCIMKVFLARILVEYNVSMSSKMKSPVTYDNSVYYYRTSGWRNLVGS